MNAHTDVGALCAHVCNGGQTIPSGCIQPSLPRLTRISAKSESVTPKTSPTHSQKRDTHSIIIFARRFWRIVRNDFRNIFPFIKCECWNYFSPTKRRPLSKSHKNKLSINLYNHLKRMINKSDNVWEMKKSNNDKLTEWDRLCQFPNERIRNDRFAYPE